MHCLLQNKCALSLDVVDTRVSIDTRELAPGVYIVIVEDANGVKQLKFNKH